MSLPAVEASGWTGDKDAGRGCPRDDGPGVEAGVAVGGLDLEDAAGDLEDGDVKGAAAEVRRPVEALLQGEVARGLGRREEVIAATAAVTTTRLRLKDVAATAAAAAAAATCCAAKSCAAPASSSSSRRTSPWRLRGPSAHRPRRRARSASPANSVTLRRAWVSSSWRASTCARSSASYPASASPRPGLLPPRHVNHTRARGGCGTPAPVVSGPVYAPSPAAAADNATAAASSDAS
jgi:hypothetical protein